MTTPAEAFDLALRANRAGDLAQAEQLCRQILQLDPRHVEALHLLSLVNVRVGRHDVAIDYIGQAIRLKPDFAPAHNNLGVILADLGRLDEAVASSQRALALKPDFAEAHFNLGISLQEQGKIKKAAASYLQTVHLKPDYPEAHYNLGRAWLLLGRLEQGWREFEWRLKCKGFSLPSLRQTPWDGSSLGGRTILLRTEQGFGDTLQFIRYARLVGQQGGRVIVACQRPLARLLASCPGIAAVVAEGDPLPEFDVYAPLLSLPGLVGTTLATVPTDVPYLAADPDQVAHWRHKLGSVAGFRIGIAWQGAPQHRRDRFRSIPLSQFAPLADIEGVRLFGLQKGFGRDQLAALDDRFAVTDLGDHLDDFLETAAVLRTLDLVITADTAVAHLAGALGVPVWVALPFSPDWRWLLEREDSPWYPTMRLFRQARSGDWEGVFQRMAGALTSEPPWIQSGRG